MSSVYIGFSENRCARNESLFLGQGIGIDIRRTILDSDSFAENWWKQPITKTYDSNLLKKKTNISITFHL